MIPDQMEGGIPQVHSATVDFFLSVILIRLDYLQIFEIYHNFKGFIACVFLFCFECCWL